DACANPQALTALGEAALRQNNFPLAYAIAGAGLAQGGETQARFLFLRVRSLPEWAEERCSDCLAAASGLARRQHDSGLLKRIGEWRDQELDWLDIPEQAQTAPDAAEIGRVVQRELKEKTIPVPPPDLPDDEECACPVCRAERGEMPEEFAEMLEQFGPE